MFTLVQAAERLGLSAETLRNQVKKGKLTAMIYGKTYVVTEEEIERYRREHMGPVGRPRKVAAADEPRDRGR
jgi:excisionase family DNA binding protein